MTRLRAKPAPPVLLEKVQQRYALDQLIQYVLGVPKVSRTAMLTTKAHVRSALHVRRARVLLLSALFQVTQSAHHALRVLLTATWTIKAAVNSALSVPQDREAHLHVQYMQTQCALHALAAAPIVS